MNYMRLLRIWNRLKRLLRGLIIKTGMGKPIDWAKSFAEFMGILEAVADVQDSMERNGQIPPTPDSDPQVPMTDSDPTPTQDSSDPYEGLLPTKKDNPSHQIEQAKKKSEEKQRRRRLFGRK